MDMNNSFGSLAARCTMSENYSSLDSNSRNRFRASLHSWPTRTLLKFLQEIRLQLAVDLVSQTFCFTTVTMCLQNCTILTEGQLRISSGKRRSSGSRCVCHPAHAAYWLRCLVLVALAPTCSAVWNNSKCPSFWELQAPHVVSDFQLEEMAGFYYELAFHDVTQRPLCPTKPRCITSNKFVQRYQDGVRFVNDSWRLQCFEHVYPQDLLFNETEHPGFLRGYIPSLKIPFLPPNLAAGLVFPDIVVDFKAGHAGWLLEFQCLEFFGGVHFVGINFYAKQKSAETFDEIYAAAVNRGFDFWMLEKPWGLSRVDHSNCPHDPKGGCKVV